MPDVLIRAGSVSARSSTAHPLTGAGWTLKLNPGWQLRAAKRNGDYIVQRK